MTFPDGKMGICCGNCEVRLPTREDTGDYTAGKMHNCRDGPHTTTVVSSLPDRKSKWSNENVSFVSSTEPMAAVGRTRPTALRITSCPCEKFTNCHAGRESPEADDSLSDHTTMDRPAHASYHTDV